MLQDIKHKMSGSNLSVDESNKLATMQGDTEARPAPSSNTPLTYMVVPVHMQKLLLDGLLVLIIAFLILMFLKYSKKPNHPKYCAKVAYDPDTELIA